MAVERDHLLPPAAEGFELAEVTFPLVDKQDCVIIKTNAYSVPARAGSRVEARVYPLQVELWHGGRRMACHETARLCPSVLISGIWYKVAIADEVLDRMLDLGRPAYVGTACTSGLSKPMCPALHRRDTVP